MYSVVTWDIDPTAGDPTVIESEAMAALGDRKVCEVYGQVRILEVSSTTDFLVLHEDLDIVAEAHPEAFRFAAWALRSGAPMRTSSSLAYDRDCAKEVISG